MRWSIEKRNEAADLFEQGYGYKYVASRLGISREAVREWSYAYRALGREGLNTKGKQRFYTPETKLAVAKERTEGGASMVEVMKRYGVGNRRQVKEWCNLYEKQGTSAFGL